MARVVGERVLGFEGSFKRNGLVWATELPRSGECARESLVVSCK